MKLKGKKALILVEDLYQEMELWYPLYRLKEEGAEVFTVAPEKGRIYKSKLGYPVTSDMSADEVRVADFDAVIVPGGYAPDLMRRHPAMVRIVSDALEAGKVLAAICHGGWMLASAGVLRGKTVTGFFSIRDDLVHAGATYVDREVVVDGNLVTSRKPDDLPAFMAAVIDAMSR
ncbi:MAG: type 1 glutamine amidotransferase domain-containing protein [Thermodesulfobacteriota bacterium]|jgi:protease I|uniref:Type 1 glutamine amidotransferase n=1 Tax=Desulfoglaeba alkanexedens ALDC TaxID=980445 RepID=A0A4P8L440_9BACT|nr:type 1 glutamine amidotransferase domain-containing protein [Desulfoglaeba alkanexedens]MDY6909483.1 type 1 glutamine amidotransferase domain-containing protein [Thermodesulfobacteriota bacterium]QCQ22736.1 type 1 glutamine amidotransferase [Desulfoglaeba alkanexedens ALDC]